MKDIIMITLDLPPKLELAISQQAQQSGLSLEHYLIQQISTLVSQPSISQFVQGKRLESFPNDVVAWQQENRDE